MSTITETLKSWVSPDVADDRRAHIAIGVIAFAVAAAFGAQVAVRLPWTPVPVTLQPLLVILAGAVLGPRAGALSMAAYLSVGALGAPVFANGGAGLPWLLGPTGGYLLAAPAGAFVAGAVAGAEGKPLRLAAGLTLGVVTMYIGGVTQLLALTGQGFGHVFAIGVVPFFVGDVTKVVLAFFLVRSVRRKGPQQIQS